MKENKYLGVQIDENLNFDRNTSHICKKIGMKLSTLGRLRNELNFSQKLYIYKTIIEPHFTYCATIIYLSTETDLNRLQILQNKCMRLILSANQFTSSDTMLNVLDLMSVRQLIIFKTLIFIYKIIQGEAPEYLSNRIIYKYQTQNRTLRNSNDINLTDANKACSQNSLFYKGIKLFNSLPSEIKNCETISQFKKLLKKFVKENF